MRLDQYLYINEFTESRTKAQNLIKQGRVSVNGTTVSKVSFEVSDSDDVIIACSDEIEFVGRGGNKLEYTFGVFKYSVENKICVDIGASTGGFTQCLLMHGAKLVYAIDSGKNQLNSVLKKDVRVISIEGFNARNLTKPIIDDNIADVVVMDVSFISQKLLYPAISAISKSGTDVITLIKPQFEAGKSAIGKKGIVKDEKVRKQVVQDVIDSAISHGFEFVNVCESPITGGDGNVEYLLHLKVK